MKTDIKTPYDSVLIGKLLLAIAYEEGMVLNVTKVQKLLYVLYGFYLAEENLILLNEQPKAWPFGPVFPRTRKKIDFTKVYYKDAPEIQEVIKKDKTLTNNIKEIVLTFEDWTARKLTEWSHQKNSPWDKTQKKRGFKWGYPIDNDDIKTYFKKILNGE